MIRFYDGKITDILPGNLTDSPKVKALGYALREGTRMLCDYAERVYIYTAIDAQPGEVLDLLAAELRAQYYRGDMDLDTKRSIVGNALIWHMTAGTPEAVEGLIAAVFGKGKVEEWFEYGGEPYHFRVTADTGFALTPEKDKLFREMLQKVKNTRSHLESVEIRRRIDQMPRVGVGQYSVQKAPAILCRGIDTEVQDADIQ